jgi:hypothetical protein
MQELAKTAQTQELSSLGSCQSQGYGACTNWSNWSITGQTCTYDYQCVQCVRVQTFECQVQIDPTPECCQYYDAGPMSRDSYERYQVCFNQAGASCTNTETQTYNICGC